MCNISRDGTDKNRLTKDQPEWEATTKGGKTIKMQLVNNCFRKHFALESKKATPTPQEDKIKHKMEKRLLMSQPAKEAGLINSGPQKSLGKRYGSSALIFSVIDLSVVNLKTVLNEMATQMDAGDVSGKFFLFTFSTQCVVDMSGAVKDGALDILPAVHTNKINLHVTKTGEDTYKIG